MATTAPIAAQAAEDLRAVREQWGDLLAAIERAPAAEWPPRDSRALGVVPEADEPSIGRLPLTLREHPAPLNLAALDAALSVERDLFHLADVIADAVQRPVRYTATDRHGRHRYQPDAADRDDPARWHLPTHSATVTGRTASAGSRAYGLHWAAVWIEGRALGEDVTAPRPSNTVHLPLFSPVRPVLLDQIAATARRARRTVEQALGRDGRPTALDQPCPYCRGPLTAHTRSGDPAAATVVCATGSACTAPVLLDRGRRMWRGAELVTLYVAMEAAAQRSA
ncbi:hypothetical protein [Streptomyces sp. NPDC096323]|uniref:hypothetical protein n=1 Tax=Streptomyces sp. NPDC096323 TaxID=3155822 RepID=UPI003322800D